MASATVPFSWMIWRNARIIGTGCGLCQMFLPRFTPMAPLCIPSWTNSNTSFSVSTFGPPAITTGTGQPFTTLSKFSHQYVFTTLAPSSAAILQQRPRKRASLFSNSLPTAVTAITGIPYSSASFTSVDRFNNVWRSYSLPIKTDSPTAEALSLIASFIEVVIPSFAKSFPITLVPPDNLSIIGMLLSGGTHDRSTPRVTNSASLYGRSGFIVSPGFSNFDVGPRKYPWSIGINRHFPSGLIICDKRFFIPQSIIESSFVYSKQYAVRSKQ